jgi:hypothetical protein
VGKTLYLQVPTFLVRNEGVQLNATDFTMWASLKNAAFITGCLELSVDHLTLKNQLNIKDSRVLKTSLTTLYRHGLINSWDGHLPKRKPLMIDVDGDVVGRKPFTQLPATVLSHIRTIGHIGLRILFYYESRINRTRLQRQFCFSSFESISKELGISPTTLSKYNTLLVSSGLLTITKSALATDNSYNSDGSLIFNRFNNHYTPNIDRI